MQNSKKTIQRKGIIKFDSQTAKTLPISTGRKRKIGWIVERVYNDLTLSIKAFESLNFYDLIALFQMLDDYSKKKEKWEYKGTTSFEDDNFERILMYRKFDLKELCKQRKILTKKANRKSIAESFERWYKAEIIYKRKNDVTKTRYIFEFKVDTNFNYIEILANANFLDFCLKNGMSMNWERLNKYGKNYYTIALDIYLQFSAIAYSKKTKKYKYPNIVKEETLFKHTGIDEEVKEPREKRRKLKKAFEKFEEITGQTYVYNKEERKWIKASYLNYINEKNKR